MPPDATGDYQKHWPCIVVVRMAGYRHFKLSVEETMLRNCQNIEIINDLFEIQLGNECNRGLSKALALHQFLTLALDAWILSKFSTLYWICLLLVFLVLVGVELPLCL